MQQVQLDNGVTVHHVTDDPQLKDNIYCERSYCTPDSRCFVFQRKEGVAEGYAWKEHVEYVACDFGTWRMRSLGRGISYAEVTPRGRMYHVRPAGDGYELVRVDVATGEACVIPVDGSVKPMTGMTVSPDERFLAYGVELGYEPQMFGVEVVDMQTGEKRVVCRDADISNPHPEFEPSEGRVLLIQQNRGCRFEADGRPIRWVGEEGATLLKVAAADGAMTRMPVGLPYTPPITGHQQWVAQTGTVLLSTSIATDEAGIDKGLVAVGKDGSRRVVNAQFSGHVHASRCGRLFCCDHVYPGQMFVGNIATGVSREVCVTSPRTRELVDQFGQMADPHAYLSPDLKWMVFQSCESGSPQIHVASIPADLIEELLQS